MNKHILALIAIAFLTIQAISSYTQNSTLGDTLMSFNAGVLTPTPDRSLYGIEFAEGFLWATGFDPDDLYQHKLYKFSSDGQTLVDYYEYGIEFAGWKDLAFDGTYLYVADVDTIRQIDPQTGQKTGFKIPGPEYYLSGLAYDPDNDRFWVSGDGNTIFEIDKSGTIHRAIPFIPDLPAAGLAWDSWTQGGPYLWVWSMKYTPTDVRPKAIQINVNTGAPTGVEFEGVLMNPSGIAADYALGATITADLIEGKVSFVGMHASSYLQNNDQLDWVVAYDLDPEGIGIPGPQVNVNPTNLQNNLMAGDSVDIPILINNLSEEYELNWMSTLQYPGISDTAADLGDSLLAFDASIITPDTNNRMRAVAYIGDYIYVSTGIDFNDQFKLFKMTKNGSSVVQTFTLFSAFNGWRTITADDQYIYGVEQYSITKFDPTIGTVVENYPKTGFSPSAMAYDPSMEHFFLGNGNGAIKQIDKSDNEINFVVTPYDIQGLSWDNWSPGGPYLWAYYIGDSDSTLNAIRLDPETGTSTGVEFYGMNMNADPTAKDLPEGIFITPDWQQNKLVMLALQESNTLPGDGHDKVVVYDLATTPPPGWIELLPPSFGLTEAQGQDTLMVRMKAIMEDTLVVAEIVIRSNDVINPEVVIPVNFTMMGTATSTSEHIHDAGRISLYPNPAKEQINLFYDNDESNTAQLVLKDLNGKTVLERGVISNQVNNLNVSKLKPGLYILTIQSAHQVYRQKLIIH
jgi:hypothetical protein